MSDYIEYLKELFSAYGEVEFRKMFGAYGVFHHGLMFALVANDVLFFKVDKALADEYEKMGLVNFSYNKKNKPVKLSYYQAPEDALEDPDQLVIWASRSFDVALKANQN